MGTRTCRAVLLAVLGTTLTMFAAGSQTTGPHMPPLVGESMYGPDLFNLYCATCHGRDAMGKGPVAHSLKIPPPDLTLLARRNGGLFPRGRVKAAIEAGTATPAHGSVDMPVWGPIFRALDPSDARVEVRINNLVSHIASIQQK